MLSCRAVLVGPWQGEEINISTISIMLNPKTSVVVVASFCLIMLMPLGPETPFLQQRWADAELFVAGTETPSGSCSPQGCGPVISAPTRIYENSVFSQIWGFLTPFLMSFVDEFDQCLLLTVSFMLWIQ